jgi:D-alanine-D-alanine ligase-like ATP-grasp enzyme
MSLLRSRATAWRVSQSAEFGKVAVLLGGDSSQRELQAAALATFRVTECCGWGRGDFRQGRANGRCYFIRETSFARERK